jgi:hypothetical protein
MTAEGREFAILIQSERWFGPDFGDSGHRPHRRMFD